MVMNTLKDQFILRLIPILQANTDLKGNFFHSTQ